MIFKTRTGSCYEVDREASKIRRLSGKNDPTSRQGQDGEWKPYEYLAPIVIGQGATIIWGSDTPLLPETKSLAALSSIVVPMTYTSDVESVEE